jgi:diguanylate cyclase (GGDEF)-like protein
METKYQENILKITISLGIATYNYHEKINDITLLKRADDALYKSKKTGRNKTTSFKSGLLTKAQDMDYNESNQPSLK